MILKYLFLVALVVNINASFAIGLNDLSILLPLPKEDTYSNMLKPFDSGNEGALLDKVLYNRFYQLVPNKSKMEIWNNQLAVVAIRLDPCFFEGTIPTDCRRQIRLVWQPIFKEGASYSTRDAAIHSFYEFDSNVFKNILAEWKKWAKTNKNLALSIHPEIKKEGLDGQSWNKIKTLILNHCGTNNLVRMTSMNVSGSDQLWIFSGFDINQGIAKEIIIPRINDKIQSITQSSFDINHFWGSFNPMPKDDFEFNELIDDSMEFKKYKNDNDVILASRSLLKFENPKIHNTGTLDCASCHLANMAHQWIEKNYPHISLKTELSDIYYKSKNNLFNTTKFKSHPNQFRIFGYFKNEPIVSQRLINETSEVKDYIELMLK